MRLIAGLALAIALLAGASVTLRTVLTAQTNAREHAVRAAGAPVVAAIQRYRDSTGNYPPDLATLRLRPPTTPLGPLRYRRYKDGQDFALVAGDYSRDFEELGWTARGWFVNR